ncbi:hypothetical protein [Pseudonocardia dioxanivorans]|uniref:hypothetical protein n=1 Tax=Pseudonocardia dioxanivorans TaxID=240495 RepID=UPI0005A20CBC|nr:hypothetical protein [Pseudonocardia dioxanivorans]
MRRSGRRAGTPAAAPCTVTVCRGCCCGTDRKHPGVDHAAQLSRITDGIGTAGRVRVSDCLDACAQSNVVVVAPSTAGRAAGARPVWLRDVLDADVTEDVVTWVRAGGPGVADPPDLLDLFVFTPARKVRAQLDR